MLRVKSISRMATNVPHGHVGALVITKKRPAKFRGGATGGLEASQIFVVGESRLEKARGWRRRFFGGNNRRYLSITESVNGQFRRLSRIVELEDDMVVFDANFHGQIPCSLESRSKFASWFGCNF